MDQYRYLIGRILQVKFIDNNSKPLKVEAGIDLASIIERRVFPVLANQSQLFPSLLRDLRGFEFLGYSMSGLKKRKAVWFFQRQDGLDAEAIRRQIGDWDVKREANLELARSPSKWGARISLAFTESRPVLSLPRADWARPGYDFLMFRNVTSICPWTRREPWMLHLEVLMTSLAS
jgi:hypothetical protein